MIKKIKQSILDQQYIASRPYTVSPINVDFKTVLVNKPWGNEYLMYSNPEIEIWNLFLRPQRSTSMHCHPNKRTSLLVLDGRAIFSSLNESWELMAMDTMVIDQGVFHTTQCISKEGLQLLEFETPPMKHDLLRLEDKYGRAQKGYEGPEGMTINYDRIRFFDNKNHNKIEDVCNSKMCIKYIKNANDVANMVAKNNTLVAVLSGTIKSKTGERIYLPTNIFTTEELRDTDYSFNNVSVLLIGKDSI
ncbi:MAG: hypothetical protein AAB857_01315 [Patescibacteria group bacterium]